MVFSGKSSGQLNDLFDRIAAGFDETAEKILNKIPVNKRKPVLINAGVTVFLLILVVVISMITKPKEEQVQEPRALSAIPADDLFLPDEPDFMPQYLLEREPAAGWNIDSVRPFWKDPLANRHEFWLNEMTSLIDEMLENVP